MTRCLFGSKKQASAPVTFKVNSGAICFLLNIDSPICELLDKIPSLVGESWKEILKEVAGSAFSFVNSDDVDTAAFCSVDPPPLPPDITYAEVFQLIASYVPPFNLVASSSPILKKISDYYLFTKWQEFCECKDKDDDIPEPDRDDDGFEQPTPLPRIGLDDSPNACPPNADRIAANEQIEQLENANNDVKNATDSNNQDERSRNNRQALEEKIAVFIANYGGTIPIDENYFIEVNSDERPTSQEDDFTITSGCIDIQVIGLLGFQYGIENFTVALNDIEGNFIDRLAVIRLYQKPFLYRIGTIDISKCNCEPPKPPKVPEEGGGEGCECIPVPPKRFCALFPEDPLCANVPDKEGEPSEPTEIEVASFDGCEQSTKIVYWRLD